MTRDGAGSPSGMPPVPTRHTGRLTVARSVRTVTVLLITLAFVIPVAGTWARVAEARATASGGGSAGCHHGAGRQRRQIRGVPGDTCPRRPGNTHGTSGVSRHPRPARLRVRTLCCGLDGTCRDGGSTDGQSRSEHPDDTPERDVVATLDTRTRADVVRDPVADRSGHAAADHGADARTHSASDACPDTAPDTGTHACSDAAANTGTHAAAGYGLGHRRQ